jgi:UDP-3-O-[3-hydroxymyristoyl] glucosamine N-acyltransferase
MHQLQQSDFLNIALCDFQHITWPLTITQTGFTWSKNTGSLVLAMSKKYILEANKNSNVNAVICPIKLQRYCQKPGIISDEAESIFFSLHNRLSTQSHQNYIHKSAQISASAHIESGVYIAENVIIEAHCYIGGGSSIKKNVYIGPNSIIGTQGMLPKNIFGKKTHIQHLGGVIIDEHCVIHAGSNISKALHYGDHTLVGARTHLGIQVNIAHDVTIGENCEISGQTIIAGRAFIGDHVWIGTNVTVSNWVTIGDHASIKLGSTVINDVASHQEVSGSFAINHKKNLLSHGLKLQGKA